MTPKRVVSEEDFAMYEAVIKKGRKEFEKGETVLWENVKKKMNRQKKS